jgi:hypothetical protein
MHLCAIDLSDNSDAGFYAAGSAYDVAIVGAVIDTKTVNAVIGHFSIEKFPPYTAIPGSPTANSINERIATMDGLITGTLSGTTNVNVVNWGGAALPTFISTADVNAEVDAALADINLDHLLKVAKETSWAVTVTKESVIDLMTSKATSQEYDRLSDSLEAIRDRGDLSWLTGAGQSADTVTFPSSATKVTGTLTGTYTNLDAVDANYLTMQEASSGTFLEVILGFAAPAGNRVATLRIWGNYAGGASHFIRVQAADQIGGAIYEDIGTMPMAATVQSYSFNLAPNHIHANGSVSIKFLHNASASGITSHYLYLDKVQLSTITPITQVDANVIEVMGVAVSTTSGQLGVNVVGIESGAVDDIAAAILANPTYPIETDSAGHVSVSGTMSVTLTGTVDANVVSWAGGALPVPAAAGEKMDLVNVLNTFSVAQIQAGLCTTTDLSTGLGSLNDISVEDVQDAILTDPHYPILVDSAGKVSVSGTVTVTLSGSITVGDVVLATLQPNYAPAKAGDKMDLVSTLNTAAVTQITALVAKTGADSDTLETLSDQIDTIQNQVSTIVPQTDSADSQVLTKGTVVTGSYIYTQTDDDTNKFTLRPANLTEALDVTLKFQLGAGRSVTSVSVNGYWNGSGQYVHVQAYDYVNLVWDQISNTSTRMNSRSSDANYSYPLNREHMDPATGEVSIRFVTTSTAVANRLYLDSVLVSSVAIVSTGVGGGITAQDVWDYGTRTLTGTTDTEPLDVPTVAEIAAALLINPTYPILTDIDGKVSTSGTITVGDVTLAASQPNYAPAKAGAKMDLIDTPSSTALNAIVAAFGTTFDAEVATAVWTAAARTLTAYGTLDAAVATAVWAAGVRTLTAIGVTFDSEIATAVWAAAGRTLSSFAFPVTASTITDKTGYSLTSSYDPAKTAAQAADLLDLHGDLVIVGASVDDLTIAVGTLNDVSTTEVHQEVYNALTVDVYAEPTGPPPATASLKDKLNWLFTLAKNQITQTSTLQSLKNDAGSGNIGTTPVSDDGYTFTRGKWS